MRPKLTSLTRYFVEDRRDIKIATRASTTKANDAGSGTDTAGVMPVLPVPRGELAQGLLIFGAARNFENFIEMLPDLVRSQFGNKRRDVDSLFTKFK
jgi:hypothetical protein